MYKHRHGARFARTGHILRTYGKKSLLLCEGEPCRVRDARTGYDQFGGRSDVQTAESQALCQVNQLYFEGEGS